MEKLTLIELEHLSCEISYIIGRTHAPCELANKLENIEFAMAKKNGYKYSSNMILLNTGKFLYVIKEKTLKIMKIIKIIFMKLLKSYWIKATL